MSPGNRPHLDEATPITGLGVDHPRPHLGGKQDAPAIFRALERLDRLATAHGEWLKNWHLSVLSELAGERRQRAEPPPAFTDREGALDEPVFADHPQRAHLREQLRSISDRAESLAETVRCSATLPTEDYSALMDAVVAFNSALRQLRNDIWNRLANVDALTGLGDRQAMWERLNIECERHGRDHQPCCVAMLDLDSFKEINDTYGHAAGDQVLRRVASLLAASVRPYDAVFRFGGDEFVLCLPTTDLRAAWAIVERLRLKLANDRIALKDGRTVAITASVGIALLTAEDGVELALENADAALYTAKRNGRNGVHVWSGAARPSSAGGAR